MQLLLGHCFQRQIDGLSQKSVHENSRSEKLNRMSDCLFCKIVSGDIPADIVLETDRAIAFRDIDPKAPSHILVIPRTHYDNITELTSSDASLAGHLLEVVTQVVQQETLMRGYRLVANTGPDGGQTVDHMHFHVLGGRSLTWPPG